MMQYISVYWVCVCTLCRCFCLSETLSVLINHLNIQRGKCSFLGKYSAFAFTVVVFLLVRGNSEAQVWRLHNYGQAWLELPQTAETQWHKQHGWTDRNSGQSCQVSCVTQVHTSTTFSPLKLLTQAPPFPATLLTQAPTFPNLTTHTCTYLFQPNSSQKHPFSPAKLLTPAPTFPSQTAYTSIHLSQPNSSNKHPPFSPKLFTQAPHPFAPKMLTQLPPFPAKLFTLAATLPTTLLT